MVENKKDLKIVQPLMRHRMQCSFFHEEYSDLFSIVFCRQEDLFNFPLKKSAKKS